MREPKLIDYFLLTFLALIWASAFFNIKIATYSYGPVMISFLRIFFGAIPVVGLCLFKKIKIEAFSKDWYWFALIGVVNLVIPFFFNSLWCSKGAKQSSCNFNVNYTHKCNDTRTFFCRWRENKHNKNIWNSIRLFRNCLFIFRKFIYK